ncbi:MAG: ImmA/IrrE family metallo-endopeptidase [Acidobacteria bacterium]|nr:ImmA/IrrE family metallo-endopeptidase [Acidobacteriota bacterium]
MAITQEELGKRIRAARESCRMTQESVAGSLGLSRPVFVQIEAGNRSISSLELGKLAYLFGRDIREFLAESFHREDALAALFRAQPEVTGDPVVVDSLRKCMALGRELTRLERMVGLDRDLPTVAAYTHAAPRTQQEAIDQGQRLAEEERRRLGVGCGPMPDLAELLESQGVRTGLVDLPDDVSGLTLSDREVGLFVVVNRLHHHYRRRFSFAHEYAHVLTDRDRYGFISRVSDREDLLEVRANVFAANFLMPTEGVRQFVTGLGKGRPSRTRAEVFDEVGSLPVEGRTQPGSQTIKLYDVVQMAHHFGVSRTSALYRLRNLRLLTNPELDLLKGLDEAGQGRQLAELLGLPEPDHSELRGAFRHRFLGLALEGYRRDEISYGKLKELVAMVGLEPEALERLVAEADIGSEPMEAGE